jgi:hypothetical protein
VPGDLDLVLGAEVGEYLPLGFLELLFDHGDLFLDANAEGVRFRVFFQLVQLGLQFSNRLFEVEVMFHQGRNLASLAGAGNIRVCGD